MCRFGPTDQDVRPRAPATGGPGYWCVYLRLLRLRPDVRARHVSDRFCSSIRFACVSRHCHLGPSIVSLWQSGKGMIMYLAALTRKEVDPLKDCFQWIYRGGYVVGVAMQSLAVIAPIPTSLPPPTPLFVTAHLQPLLPLLDTEQDE
jgi:hypothetical protein